MKAYEQKFTHWRSILWPHARTIWAFRDDSEYCKAAIEWISLIRAHQNPKFFLAVADVWVQWTAAMAWIVFRRAIILSAAWFDHKGLVQNLQCIQLTQLVCFACVSVKTYFQGAKAYLWNDKTLGITFHPFWWLDSMLHVCNPHSKRVHTLRFPWFLYITVCNLKVRSVLIRGQITMIKILTWSPDREDNRDINKRISPVFYYVSPPVNIFSKLN